jgi:hypothetical protein
VFEEVIQSLVREGGGRVIYFSGDAKDETHCLLTRQATHRSWGSKSSEENIRDYQTASQNDSPEYDLANQVSLPYIIVFPPCSQLTVSYY